MPFGRLTRAHGVRGELRLVPYNLDDDLPGSVEQVRLTDARGVVRFERVVRVRPVNDALLVTLESVRDRDAAQALGGSELAIPEATLPGLEDGELYLYELFGATAFDESGAELGVVRGTMSNGMQDLLRIEGSDGERLLPMVDDTIVAWDRDKRSLTVKVAEGLWDD